MLLLNKKTSFSGVSWWYGTIVGSLFNGGSKIFLRGGGGNSPLRNTAVTYWWCDVPN